VEATDLHELGEDGVIPTKCVYKFRFRGGPLLTLEVQRNPSGKEETSWLMAERTFELCEARCTWILKDREGKEQATGWGMSEFGYNLHNYQRPVGGGGKKRLS